MTTAPFNRPVPRRLRVWPGVFAVTVQWLAWFIVPTVFPEAGPYGIFVGLCAGLAVLLWWLFLSRAPWSERGGAIVLIVIAIVATKRLVHESIAGGGMGMLLYMYAVPVLGLALVCGTLIGRYFPKGPRRATMVGAILIGCGAFTLVRTGGITGEGDSDLHWRWTKTPEERLLEQAPDESASLTLPAETNSATEWPGFRGPKRDGIVRGVRIETDWSKSPPVQLWRRAIGPAWSSFAVQGDLFYTQEQRGEEELVSCYKVTTGEPVWTHRDATRFWESNAGAGPRATPTLSNGRVYTFGATGILNALEAGSGAVVWSRNAAADTGKKVPHWGFAASPLVVNSSALGGSLPKGDLVIVAAREQLAAYDAETGDQRWLGASGVGHSYSSPHFATIGGVAQILMLRGGGAAGVALADGALLWAHTWQPGVCIVQPAQTDDGDVLISAADEMGGLGIRRLAVRRGDSGWTVEERWTSRGLKPYFNDFVIHESHAYGFDNSILSCINLTDGARKWKGGRFGHGQLVLLADQNVLVILTEEGELALVSATPDQFTELARFPAIEGKTWNHPVLVGEILLVRNAEEMAAFRLSISGSS